MDAFKEESERQYAQVADPGKPLISERQTEEVPYKKKHMDLLAAPDMLEQMVAVGDKWVKDCEDVLKVLFISQASAYAPPIVQGERVHRAQSHVLLIGDPSTAKSSLFSLSQKMFPRCFKATDFSAAGFVGTITKDGERKRGAAERGDRCIIVVDEFDKLMARHPDLDGWLRMAMEEQHIYKETSYGIIQYDTRPVIFAGANPKGDVFRNEMAMSEQMPFKYGLLSRFDYIRPMAYSGKTISDISDYMAGSLFSEEVTAPTTDGLTIKDIESTYSALMATYLKYRVRRVAAPKDTTRQISERFASLQKEIDGVALLTVRDFMGSMRTLNASALLHLRSRRCENGILYATEDDMNTSLFILECTARNKEILLTACKREDLAISPMQKAATLIQELLLQREGAEINRQVLVDELIGRMGISKTTAYEYIKTLVATQEYVKIEQVGLRDATIRLKQ